jgi:hypothetical protein
LKDSSFEEANINGRNLLRGSRGVEVRLGREIHKDNQSKMPEKTNAVTVSRRSTRIFAKEQHFMGEGTAGQLGYDSRQPSAEQKQRERSQQENVDSSISIQVLRIPVVDLGKSLCPIFPTTSEDIEKHSTLLVALRLD